MESYLYIAETYTKTQTQIDLLNLCKFSKSRLIVDNVIGIDPIEKQVILKDRMPIKFDTLSINTGGEPNLDNIKELKNSASHKTNFKIIKVIDDIKEKFYNLKRYQFQLLEGVLEELS